MENEFDILIWDFKRREIVRGERFWWVFILKVFCCWMKIGIWVMVLILLVLKMVYIGWKNYYNIER